MYGEDALFYTKAKHSSSEKTMSAAEQSQLAEIDLLKDCVKKLEGDLEMAKNVIVQLYSSQCKCAA